MNEIKQFKTKEDLMNEAYPPNKHYEKIGLCYEMGLDDGFNSAAKRRDFYLEFKTCYMYLKSKHPSIAKLFDEKYGFSEKELLTIENHSLRHTVFMNTYRDWLFDYCFSDIK